MLKPIMAGLAAVVIGATLGTDAAQAENAKFYEVTGVDEGDMLKLRAGPGTDFRVIVGLPNGSVLRLYDCEQTGANEWCKVALKEARSLKGYVSWHYLQQVGAGN